MGFDFDLAGLTRRIAEILSRIMGIGISIPGSGGVELPLWVFLIIAVVIVFLVWNPYRKER